MNYEEQLKQQYPWLQYLQGVAVGIVNTLHEKEHHYQGSWQKRGGPGAFMMLARKWDRIEAISKDYNFDIFQAVEQNRGDIVDDINDLIGYLLLIRAKQMADLAAAAEPGPGYVNQDPYTDYPPFQQYVTPLGGHHPKHKPLSPKLPSGGSSEQK